LITDTLAACRDSRSRSYRQLADRVVGAKIARMADAYTAKN